MTPIAAVYGTCPSMQHRDGVRRWRRLASEDLLNEEEWRSVSGGLCVGYIHTDSEGIERFASAEDHSSGY